MPVSSPFRLLPVVAFLVWGAGCASVPDRKAAAPDETSLAQISAEYLVDPSRVSPQLREGQDFVAPHPIVTPLPRFPADHQDLRRPVVLVLRLVVEADGAVRQVQDSPLALPAAQADPDFRVAAVDAVLSWIFVPAAIRTIEPGEDLDHDSKPDYTILVDSHRIPVYIDVRFTFEIVDGQARVRAD
ncbi:MAG TPA: hypothetical protein VFC25_15430 [Verrucomicrobiae bacterium]|nr:hypothetical protein [Verrucomicrobiae bacterium]